MVKKNSGKWRMCVDLIDLNKPCLTDLYPLPNIDKIIHDALGSKALSFMDTFFGYNQINMSHSDDPKIDFITKQSN